MNEKIVPYRRRRFQGCTLFRYRLPESPFKPKNQYMLYTCCPFAPPVSWVLSIYGAYVVNISTLSMLEMYNLVL